MAARNFEPPLGASATVLKDLENAAAVAEELRVPLPMTSRAIERYRLLITRGMAEKDPAVLVDLLSDPTQA